MRSSTFFAAAASLSTALATIQGFNYGSTLTDGSAKSEQIFEAEFKAAKALANTNGAFSSARLYTTIQAGTANDPIAAIQAAINTQTGLLLGLWASGGQIGMDNEITALTNAIKAHGSQLANVVQGISVGSEDLYRISPTGIINKSGIGAGPDEVANYINQVKQAISGTALAGKQVGHVDTWTAWVNGSNSAVVQASDFIGVDAYPYFQSTMSNGIENGKALFYDALGQTRAAVGGKPVWVTETGWPVSGPKSGAADATIPNAKQYWDEVGCSLFGNTNTWWYTLNDAAPTTPSPSFGVLATLNSQPLYDLSCTAV
jgi:glucan endo-1,3-beta-D-glucosidase